MTRRAADHGARRIGAHPAPAALAVLVLAVLLPLWATLTAAR